MRTLLFATLLLGSSPVSSVYSQSSEPDSVEDSSQAAPQEDWMDPELSPADKLPTGMDSLADGEEINDVATDSDSLEAKESEPLSDAAVPLGRESSDAPAPMDKATAESPARSVVAETSPPAPTPAQPAPIVVQVANDELIGRMAIMEQFLVAQHEREIALYRDTIRLVIVFGVGFAVVAGLGLLAACFLNYRAIVAVQAVVLRRPAEIEEPATSGLLPASSAVVPGIERVQASGARFQSRMGKLEERLNELEHMTGQDSGDTLYAADRSDPSGETGVSQIEAPPPRRVIPRAAIMVHKAQTLMNLGKFSEALTTLDEAATYDGSNSEVHLTRGQAFEKLGKIPDAIEAYDHAVDIDQSNTNALLMKAGALNRQEKFTEALECYERALEAHRAAS